MGKIINDKYYTPKELAQYVINKTKEIIGKGNIIEYIEPSAGAGVFLDLFDMPYLAYDIEPEDKLNRIIQQNYLELDLEYKKGRCIIGNPPYGRTMGMAVKFYKKSIQLGDYIVFILPITQLDNNHEIYEFDLIHSEDLGLKYYTDRELHCCLNIYKRPDSGQLNKKPNYKLKDIEIRDYRRSRESTYENTKKENFNYDIRLCGYGSGIVGKEVKYEGQYVKELCIKINNNKLKDEIIELIKNTNWEKDVCRGISGQIGLPQWQFYKYIKEQIPEVS